MKNSIKYLLVAAVAFGFISINISELYSQNLPKEQILKLWDRITDYTIEISELMPEEKYSYKAMDTIRTWAENVNHIAESNYFWVSSIFKGKVGPKKLDKTGKKEVIVDLKYSFATARKAITEFDESAFSEIGWTLNEEATRFQVFLAAVDHLTQTRGIMIGYLRVNGIAPPEVLQTYIIFVPKK